MPKNSQFKGRTSQGAKAGGNSDRRTGNIRGNMRSNHMLHQGPHRDTRNGYWDTLHNQDRYNQHSTNEEIGRHDREHLNRDDHARGEDRRDDRRDSLRGRTSGDADARTTQPRRAAAPTKATRAPAKRAKAAATASIRKAKSTLGASPASRATKKEVPARGRNSVAAKRTGNVSGAASGRTATKTKRNVSATPTKGRGAKKAATTSSAKDGRRSQTGRTTSTAKQGALKSRGSKARSKTRG